MTSLGTLTLSFCTLLKAAALKGGHSHVHYDLETPATYLTQALGDQFIRDDQGEGERP